MGEPSDFFLTKSELEQLLGFTMRIAYRNQIFTEDIVIELGFESLYQFKTRKSFSILESKSIREYLRSIGLR